MGVSGAAHESVIFVAARSSPVEVAPNVVHLGAMKPRSSMWVGTVLMALGGTALFFGFALAVLGWITNPWIGDFGALPWICMGAGALMVGAGLFLVIRR